MNNKMNVVKQIVLMAGVLLACFPIAAQEHLNVGAIFDSYGRREGSVLIELRRDVLGGHTRIGHYRSLVVPSDSGVVRATEEALAGDVRGGRRLMESRRNGRVERASYCLTRGEGGAEYEYLLFAGQSHRMTLIYVKGDFPPHQLEDELYRLKNLFIEVNNKHIKQ